VDYKELDAKWQKAWDDAKIFESDVGRKESYMVSVAFPYVNAPQHIGHMRVYGTADVLARYKRMRGFNVLFPMGFHATGTPILAFAKRLSNDDKDLIAELKVFHIPDEEIKKMTDPVYIANYFVKEIEGGMHRAGYSIDWRRRFVSIDPFFSKFIEWQFGILNKKGYLIQGKHPVGWCPNENNAVGMHDTKKDVEPDIEKEVAVKFKVDGEDSYMVCATYRPETIFGVTNLFVSEGSTYITCKIDGKGTYYIAKEAALVLRYQMAIEQIGEIEGTELIKKTCINPMTDSKIPVLPGFFVKEGLGTGMVMSVPAHAPFDYIALQRLKKAGRAPEITPIRVLEIQDKSASEYSKAAKKTEYLDMPSLAYIEMFKTGDAEETALEAATKLQYKEESHYAKMIQKGYEGMSEPDARDKITGELLAADKAFDIYALANNPVYCRCGYNVVVKVVDNQWFLNYGNPEWKKLAKECFAKMTILPEKSRRAFEAAIDWIDLRAVARSQGLGTRFPLDRDYIIESLSDSTIYMAFYTISNLIRDVQLDRLKPEFFDYVFLDKGNLDSVAQWTGIDYQIINRCNESFDYWYRNTSRHSGPDLIFNHLTMYIFNNSAIFGKEYWPKQIVVNGSVLSEGEKMSKSLGNIVPLSDALDKYGADVLRAMVVAGADLFSDSEFSEDAAKGLDERFGFIYDVASKANTIEGAELRHIDYWMYSKLNRKIKMASEQIEKLELRSLSTNVIYNSILELRKYFGRGDPNGVVVKDYISAIVLLMAPITPHISEEMWHMIGNDTFASMEKWPSFDESMISDKIEAEEELLESMINDAKQVMSLMRKKGREPKAVRFIVADDWKRDLNNELCKTRNIKALMDRLGADPNMDMEKIGKYVQKLAKNVNALKSVSSTQEGEYAMLTEAKDYLSSSLKCEIEVEMEGKSKSPRAANAMPERPSIDIS